MKDINNKIIICDNDSKPQKYRYYFIDCLGRSIFLKSHKRLEAQKICDEYTGEKNKYSVRDSQI